MKLKRIGWSCLIVGVVGEMLEKIAWWKIGGILSAGVLKTYPLHRLLADFLDSAGTVAWLGIALLIVAYTTKDR